MVTPISSVPHNSPAIQKPVEPTSAFPFWHFNCSCGKPVKADMAWWDGKEQVHFACLKKE